MKRALVIFTRRAQQEDEGSRATPAESAPSLTACGGSAQDDVVVSPRPASRIPALRSANLDPADFAHSTCFDAGYLAVKNAGWRNMRPVIGGVVHRMPNATSTVPTARCTRFPSACQPTEAADAAASPAPDLAAMPKARVPKYPLRGFLRGALRLRHPWSGHRGNAR